MTNPVAIAIPLVSIALAVAALAWSFLASKRYDRRRLAAAQAAGDDAKGKVRHAVAKAYYPVSRQGAHRPVAGKRP